MTEIPETAGAILLELVPEMVFNQVPIEQRPEVVETLNWILEIFKWVEYQKNH